MRIVAVAAWVAFGCVQPVLAQDVAAPTVAAPPATPALPAPAPCCVIPALTEIEFEFTTTINSQANKIGETFPIRLSAPIIVDGLELIPAGTMGHGEIVHAAKSRFGGKAGELILGVRALDYNDTAIPLRSLRYRPVKTPGRGRDNGDTAAAVAIAGGAVGSVVSMFITGGEVNITAGTIANAKTAAAVTITKALPTPEGDKPQ